MTTRCRAFGLVIESDVPMSGLVEASTSDTPDVRVELREGHWDGWHPRGRHRPWFETDGHGDGRPWLTVWRLDAFRFEYAEGAVFTISADGGVVSAQWRPPLTRADAVSFLIGPILAFVLRLRGVVPLHASAVELGGKAVVFVGAAGAGKSTLAAALGAQGHRVLSDDVVPLRAIGETLVADPGCARVSVWSDSASVVFGEANALETVSDTYAKHVVDALDARVTFGAESKPLAGIFLLQDRTEIDLQVTVPTSRAAFLWLLSNTYGAYLLDARLRAREFDFLGGVVERVPVRLLSLPADLRGLPGVCERLASDVLSDVAWQAAVAPAADPC